jgi:hypothetical protein
MKLTAVLLALVTLAFPASLRADTISAAINTTSKTQAIAAPSILNAEAVDDTHLNTDLLSAGLKASSKPQDAPSNSPAPGSGSLCLMATGLFGAAGVLRRKFSNA